MRRRSLFLGQCVREFVHAVRDSADIQTDYREVSKGDDED